MLYEVITKEAAEKTGAKKVFIEEEPKVAAVGAGIDISKPSGSMIIDIGVITSYSIHYTKLYELKNVNEKLDTPAAYFLVHCGGRKIGIGDRVRNNFV